MKGAKQYIFLKESIVVVRYKMACSYFQRSKITLITELIYSRVQKLGKYVKCRKPFKNK